MDSHYWKEKWATGDIRFHQAEFEPALVEYFPKLEPTTVFVPLCGKSRDMLWLAQQGHHVVGVELSELACESFFQENGIAFEKKNRGGFVIYESERVTIWRGDFFAFPADAIRGTKAFYDRAAMIALPSEMRAQYTARITELARAAESPSIFLITLEYEQSRVVGPPFSVSKAEVEERYGSAFRVEVLKEKVNPPQTLTNLKFSGVEVRQVVSRLALK